MVAAVRQNVKVLADGRLEIVSPELRAGTMTEVIVLFPSEPVVATPVDRLAALELLRKSLALTTISADEWVGEIRRERVAAR